MSDLELPETEWHPLHDDLKLRLAESSDRDAIIGIINSCHADDACAQFILDPENRSLHGKWQEREWDEYFAQVRNSDQGAKYAMPVIVDKEDRPVAVAVYDIAPMTAHAGGMGNGIINREVKRGDVFKDRYKKYIEAIDALANDVLSQEGKTRLLRLYTHRDHRGKGAASFLILWGMHRSWLCHHEVLVLMGMQCFDVFGGLGFQPLKYIVLRCNDPTKTLCVRTMSWSLPTEEMTDDLERFIERVEERYLPAGLGPHG